jgi:hypothetical protein
VEALDIERAVHAGLENASPEELRRLLELFVGDFLEGLDLNRSPQLDHWLTTRRRHFRSCPAAVLEELGGRLPASDPETRDLCERWVALAPFELAAHRALMAALPPADAERHLAAAVRLFEAQDLDTAPLRLAWRALSAAPAAVAIPEPVPGGEPVDAPLSHRASLAVMPFLEPEADPIRLELGAGLTRDIIARLAKLRALFVIAQSSVFALAERGIAPDDAGRRLNVDDVPSGVVRRRGARIA